MLNLVFGFLIGMGFFLVLFKGSLLDEFENMLLLFNVVILYLNLFWWFYVCSVWCKKFFIFYNIISVIMIIFYKCIKIIFIKIVNY